jgi:hypothetical protein
MDNGTNNQAQGRQACMTHQPEADQRLDIDYLDQGGHESVFGMPRPDPENVWDVFVVSHYLRYVRRKDMTEPANSTRTRKQVRQQSDWAQRHLIRRRTPAARISRVRYRMKQEAGGNAVRLRR